LRARFCRQSVAGRLIRAAEQWCVGRGVPKLQLMVRSENAEVACFYTALGYDKSDVIVLAKCAELETRLNKRTI
jgi:ribosomal protein S18 acetylase RimI-like enzyme